MAPLTFHALSRSRPGALRTLAIAAAVAFAAGLLLTRVAASPAPWVARVAAAESDEVRILVGEPSTFDPAAQQDSTDASIGAQLHETLTTYDAALQLQPALAASWDVAADGRSVVFHLRPNLRFSDGTPLTAEDVVGSWLRLIDPDHPASLVALMLDVKGARDFLAGRVTDPSQVGLRANGDDVEVELERPGADFPAIVSAPLFGVVGAAAWRDGDDAFGPDEPTSGGYSVASVGADAIVLERNEHYWAGAPAITTVHLVLDIGGRSPIAAFEAGDIDYTDVSLVDAPWIPYDRSLGPQLRQASSLSMTYLGIDTTRPPFDDVRIRQALGAAVDWERAVALGSFPGQVQALSMVPPGIPGGGEGSWLPAHDPEAARQLLGDAGYPNGVGLPPIQFAAGQSPVAGGIAADLERELGMKVELVILDDQLGRLNSDPPTMWMTGWIADYVGPNDFLGVLLETGSTDNYGGWSSAAFDAAIQDALATRDAAAAEAAYELALAEIQREVPVVPLYVGTNWSLAREGLLGAWDNGLGILRMAGMSWAP